MLIDNTVDFHRTPNDDTLLKAKVAYHFQTNT